MAQFINKSCMHKHLSGCEDSCCRKSILYRKRVALTFPSIGVSVLVRNMGLNTRTDPPGMLPSDLHALLPGVCWLSPHPHTPFSCCAEHCFPSNFVLSGWSSQLSSWTRLSPSRIRNAMKLPEDIQPFILVWISMGELLGNSLRHPCHHYKVPFSAEIFLDITLITPV